MNKYSIITFAVLSCITLAILYFFDLDFKWWYAILIFILSNYNGKVLNSTKHGFNIHKLSFEEFLAGESKQFFATEIVVDSKGNTKTIYGSFINDFNLSPNDLRVLLFDNTKRNEILSSLEIGESVSKSYKYKNNFIEVEFEHIS